jgi:hypothetical protein
MKKYVILVFMTFACYALGCSSALYKPVSNDAEILKSLWQGRSLYVERCSGCHNLHLPEQYTKEVWQKNLNEMQERSKITNDEKQLIFVYLTSEPSKK